MKAGFLLPERSLLRWGSSRGSGLGSINSSRGGSLGSISSSLDRVGSSGCGSGCGSSSRSGSIGRLGRISSGSSSRGCSWGCSRSRGSNWSNGRGRSSSWLGFFFFAASGKSDGEEGSNEERVLHGDCPYRYGTETSGNV